MIFFLISFLSIPKTSADFSITLYNILSAIFFFTIFEAIFVLDVDAEAKDKEIRVGGFDEVVAVVKVIDGVTIGITVGFLVNGGTLLLLLFIIAFFIFILLL